MSPEKRTTELNGGQKGSGALGITSGDAAPLLEPKEGILYQMPQFVEVGIILAGLLAGAARRETACMTRVCAPSAIASVS
ncbi:hypothetical protein AW736_22915 [Termitidicoccus mucosus]|uniref:Uncharacterized protein n=1 Tax=Termitidicoccus mucosus TaxID=1184151 RepID=A0A178IBL0_9BACT|nr:hypothetical protein AW736_22915 [Opitutaceae bacterium TSB47]